MALKKCKECDKEISTDAKVCPNCGKKQKKFGCLAILLVIMRFFIIIGMLSSLSETSTDSSTPSISVEERETIDEGLKTLEEIGFLIKINPQSNEAYVDPTIWDEVDYQTRATMGKALALYCGQEAGTDLNWVDIKDSYSGKILANYNESRGLKIY